jgi:hypothetical protein
LFRCPNWDGLCEELRAHLVRSSAVEDILNILCGPVFEDFPVDHQERQVALREAEETFRILYKMAVDILTTKE